MTISTSNDNKIRAAILGASGYTGAELVRLLQRHPNVEIVLLTADRKAGQSIDQVFPHLAGEGLPDLMAISDIEWAGLEVDVVFCALPHATSQRIIKGILHDTGHGFIDEMVAETTEDYANAIQGSVKVVDLSADFRLRDPDTYAEWYGGEHDAISLQKEAVYGLTEHYREEIKNARLVACPGCYPTAALLALIPLMQSKAIKKDGVIIDAKSGVSGAGRSLREGNLFTEVSEAMHPYGIAAHRHAPEIEQELSRAYGEDLLVSFTPHLIPMNRGELETIYVQMEEGKTASDLRELLKDRYRDERFVTVADEGVVPASRHVRGSNNTLIGVFEDRVPGQAIIVVTIDNLVKGSSGQAIQNMNLMFDFPEMMSLEQMPLFP
ncbi:N-acetyl-gamma-glutamyl-phosphate reductase [Pseudemcibacter aquimaris]|uniref:N-acetyl-gamma-glutamyl-phosphate reductase n=1 Tax=Pseudemcibacter aquimaris TaxID=2857064 RepID=UPI0020110438|nr:N-acetyl-gamma-glutamyl-phosphate reductase [Pseudemcibacter aquimaris]MCC3861067.1 N-acetyl-gamma-glutamyl-phosphate reductase [Pseudemcibacter aquimaris]WDU59885.1 N-acetyl-gamma-glutamyl-phosphate reductase [Pseudemcibacter aquimaris]